LKAAQAAEPSVGLEEQSVEKASAQEGGNISRNASKAKLPGSKDEKASMNSLETNNKSSVIQ
jgi:hypothetical protein